MDYIITCISHRRPDNIKKVFETTGTNEIVFVVNDSKDQIQYKALGAKYVITGGSLVGNRNAALDYCFKKNKICVQIDDDLQSVSLNDFTGKRTKKYTNVITAVNDILYNFIYSDFNFAGAAPTENPFFATKESQENILITAPFTLTKPNPIRFDEKLLLKEDYDYTLQHIKQGGCIRYHKYLFNFKRYGNLGGAVSYRTNLLEQETIAYLLSKWKDCIKLNPKRENEILLNRNSFNILNSKQESLF
tara:strand:- start:2359 stop:3099 length:741 start_codon:yes stop_codon:yes gene_type:complete